MRMSRVFEMPSVADETRAVDTSVAVAALDESHEAHRVCRSLAMRYRPALAGHAAFETFSVLTRLPGDARVDASTAGEILGLAFPDRCWLSARQQAALLARLPGLDVVGGAVYDALVGEAARVNGHVLLTRDERARRTYERIGVGFEIVAGSRLAAKR